MLCSVSQVGQRTTALTTQYVKCHNTVIFSYVGCYIPTNKSLCPKQPATETTKVKLMVLFKTKNDQLGTLKINEGECGESRCRIYKYKVDSEKLSLVSGIAGITALFYG